MRTDLRQWIVLAVSLTAIALSLGACSVDPGENVIAVTLVNDRAIPVTVKQCGQTCTDIYHTHHLQPADSVAVNGCVQCVMKQYWEVVDGSGQVLGCVDLNMQTRRSNVHVYLSRLVRCGHA